MPSILIPAQGTSTHTLTLSTTNANPSRTTSNPALPSNLPAIHTDTNLKGNPKNKSQIINDGIPIAANPRMGKLTLPCGISSGINNGNPHSKAGNAANVSGKPSRATAKNANPPAAKYNFHANPLGTVPTNGLEVKWGSQSMTNRMGTVPQARMPASNGSFNLANHQRHNGHRAAVHNRIETGRRAFKPLRSACAT